MNGVNEAMAIKLDYELPEYPTFEEGLRRYCRHSALRYLGSHAERHLGYATVFMDEEKEGRVREFARQLLKEL